MAQFNNSRQGIISLIFISIVSIIAIRLFVLQNVESKYKMMASDQAIFRKVVYPARGILFDRKGKPVLFNEVVNDLWVTPAKLPKNFDTLNFCNITSLDTAFFRKTLRKIIVQNGRERAAIFAKELPPQMIARLQERIFEFPGFELQERSIRKFPYNGGGLMLGYLGEVSEDKLKEERYMSYQQGDYTGINGLENNYEEILRGQRGVSYILRDVKNRPQGPYNDGKLDTAAVAGKNMQLYLDAELQAYGEKLMQNKLGSVVAIDPQTGGILAMVSSPGFDPNELRGPDRGKKFYELFTDPRKPLLNRATQALYPPGSTFKPLTALVALDEGVITPSFGYPCGGAYYACGRPIRCTHAGGGHAANLRLAMANSCNAYFCHIYRLAVDAAKWGGVEKGQQHWYDYMKAFGLGHPVGVDIPYEKGGLIPDSAFYNKRYKGVWNTCTTVFIGMGQGELQLTPLQMANAMALIANKGTYYIPHFVKSIDGDSTHPALKKYLEPHRVAKVSDTAFAAVIRGMQDVVEHGTGKVAQIPGIEVCAKTGTVENVVFINGEKIKLQNHSMFVAFAPRENPRIAIAVCVENAGYGATWAGPVASLMMEKFLNDTVQAKRKFLEDKMFNANLITRMTYVLDSIQRKKDRERELRKDSLKQFNLIMEKAQTEEKYQLFLKYYNQFYNRKKK